MKKRVCGFFVLGALLFTTLFTMSGCKKEQGFLVIIVKVVSENGIGVPGAAVRVFQDSLQSSQGVVADISDEQIAAADGTTIHTFKNMKAILFIEAKGQGLKALDIVRVEPNDQVEKTVVVR